MWGCVDRDPEEKIILPKRAYLPHSKYKAEF